MKSILKNKIKVVIILIVIIIIFFGILIFKGNNPKYIITYDVDKSNIIFHLQYSNSYFGKVNANVNNDVVMIKDKERSKNYLNIFNKIGIIKSKEDISYKVKKKETQK